MCPPHLLPSYKLSEKIDLQGTDGDEMPAEPGPESPDDLPVGDININEESRKPGIF